MTKLTIKVRERKNKGTTSFEGIVSLSGLSGKVARVKDGATSFATRSALNSTARGLGKRLGLEVEFDEGTAKKAAKKSVKSKTKAKAAKAKTTVCDTTC